jgi:tripartite ATP-independent transporter DctM subunit
VTPLEIGAIVAVVTLLVLASGVPIAFGLGIVAMLFLLIFEGPAGLSFVGEVFFSSLSDFTLVAIPMFIVMGSAIASSPAGADLYSALERWLGRLPGGLVIANLGACTLFAALSGSSPATCAAIGKMGIPEMRNRGYPAGLSAGAIAAGGTLGILIPPSVTMIVYGIATGTSIGRLFIAGLVPGVLLTGLFILWAWFASAKASGEATVTVRRYRWREKLEALPRVFPFLAIVAGILYVLYGGIATPSGRGRDSR